MAVRNPFRTIVTGLKKKKRSPPTSEFCFISGVSGHQEGAKPRLSQLWALVSVKFENITSLEWQGLAGRRRLQMACTFCEPWKQNKHRAEEAKSLLPPIFALQNDYRLCTSCFPGCSCGARGVLSHL
jgi:hypothetical protein